MWDYLGKIDWNDPTVSVALIACAGVLGGAVLNAILTPICKRLFGRRDEPTSASVDVAQRQEFEQEQKTTVTNQATGIEQMTFHGLDARATTRLIGEMLEQRTSDIAKETARELSFALPPMLFDNTVGGTSQTEAAIQADDPTATQREELRLEILAMIEAGAKRETLSRIFRLALLQPCTADRHLFTSAALQQLGEHELAAELGSSTVEMSPHDYRARVVLAYNLAKTGDLEGAVEHISEAAQLAPDEPIAHGLAGCILAKSGEADRAIGHLQEAIKLDPEKALYRADLSRILFQEEQYPDAAEQAREVIRLKPDSGEGYKHLARALLSDHLDGALTAARTAVELDPSDASGRLLLGQTLSKSGDFDGAVDEFNEAVLLRPDHASTHFCLAIAYRCIGDLDSALREAREAVRLDPERADCQELPEELTTLKQHLVPGD